jgi:peptidyl-prolyl cis-trans isomerase A (cyclophilin A)
MKKALITTTLMCAGLCANVFAQTKTGTATKKAAAPAEKPDLMKPSTLRARAPEVFRAKFATTKGDIIIECTRAWAPRGVDRFYNLVRAGFFTDVSFFRVIAGFMAQFGVSPKPEIARVWRDSNIIDDPVVKSNKRGFLTYAQSSAPNSRSTQFFINYQDNARLDTDRFAPIGQVVEGMDVVDKLYSEYGEGAPSGRGPDQGRVQAEGKAYLDRFFPKLDRIISATIVPAAPAAPKPADGKSDAKQ